MATQRKHYVTFFSPGTLFSESTTKEMGNWDTAIAAKMATEIQERHGAKPYGFEFSTRVVSKPVPDDEGGMLEVKPREVERSGLHYITGKLLKYDDVPLDGERSILRSNMRCNRWPVCIQNDNSWRFTGAFEESHLIVDEAGEVIRRGDDADLVEYRERKCAEFDAATKAFAKS